MREPSASYDAESFAQIEVTARPSAAVIAPILSDDVRPTSVLDVGCGRGYFLDAFRDLGVRETVGVDGPFEGTEGVAARGHEFITLDLQNERLALGRRFDLVLCLEVAEHLDPAVGPALVEDLVAHGDVVAFSAAIPQQTGRGHVNERSQSYWASEFARHGYHPHDVVRRRIWNDRVDWWYAPTVSADPVPLDLIHFKMNPHVMPAKTWDPTVREAAGALFYMALDRLRRIFRRSARG
jgi:SAM-dependent methyltransferase